MLTVLLLCCCRCCCCCSAVAGGQIASTAPATGANLSCHKNVQQLATKQTMRRVPTAATTTTTRPAATAATATTAAMAAFSNCANKLLLHFTFILRVRMRVVFSALPSPPCCLSTTFFACAQEDRGIAACQPGNTASPVQPPLGLARPAATQFAFYYRCRFYSCC